MNIHIPRFPCAVATLYGEVLMFCAHIYSSLYHQGQKEFQNPDSTFGVLSANAVDTATVRLFTFRKWPR